MTPPNRWWALLVVLALGFWAGGAAAQTDDDGGWFDERDTAERPQLKIHGTGQYDPPPPDFRSDPPNASSEGPAVDENLLADEGEREDAESQQRALREFSPHLAQYGYWVDDPVYGRVWVPTRSVVGPDFRPYVTGGHWELTPDDQWLWASDYPFGWVTFHYGRWAWLSTGAWGWVPGYAYAPAWVDFRIGGGGYVGWGPLPPYSVWRGGVFVSLGVARPVPYIFCPTTYVFSPSLPRYVVRDRYRVRSIASQTYRYRPRHVAGSVRVRSPSPREARIPSRYVPSRRVIAQPRGSYVASEYRRRDGVRGQRQPIYSSRTQPREWRQRSVPAPGRSRDPRWTSPPRGQRALDVGRPRVETRARSRGADPRWSRPGADGRRRDARGGSGSAWGGERHRTAPRARPETGRSRWSSPPAAVDRRAPAASERRGDGRRGDSRRGGSSSSRSPSQQRSRSRDR